MIIFAVQALLGCIDPKFLLAEDVFIPSMNCQGTITKIIELPPCRYAVEYNCDYAIGMNIFDEDQLTHKRKDDARVN